MKKKQKSAAGDVAAGSSTTDLKAVIHEHSLFFDKLIDLIPPRFYIPNDDSDKPWYQGLSKSAKASFKRQTVQNLKLARRNRLDPDNKDHSSTVELLNNSIHKNKEHMPINLEGDDQNPSSSSVTYEELRQRLRAKIEMLRGNRGENPENISRKDAKRKRSEEGDGNEIEFGKVKIGDDDDEKRAKKKKKKSKVKELDRLKRLEEVKRENPSVAERESWKAAESRAMGVKVHDDPKLLKESMKREKRRKEKSSEMWKKRVESRDKEMGERQQKRRDNIAGKVKEKKMRKIAKREKKLMRPGFEGRDKS